MAPEVSSSDAPLGVLLGQDVLLTLPLLPQVSLVRSQPGVRDFLAVAGKASPSADALPAGEAAPADGLAPVGPSLGGGAFPRHAAGELLQRGTQRHEGIHFQRLSCRCFSQAVFCRLYGNASTEEYSLVCWFSVAE